MQKIVKDRLIKLRKEKKYSIKDMANMLNISMSYYSQIENGKRNLYYKLAVNIAKIFNLLPDDIFYVEEK